MAKTKLKAKTRLEILAAIKHQLLKSNGISHVEDAYKELVNATKDYIDLQRIDKHMEVLRMYNGTRKINHMTFRVETDEGVYSPYIQVALGEDIEVPDKMCYSSNKVQIGGSIYDSWKRWKDLDKQVEERTAEDLVKYEDVINKCQTVELLMETWPDMVLVFTKFLDYCERTDIPHDILTAIAKDVGNRKLYNDHIGDDACNIGKVAGGQGSKKGDTR